MIAKETRELADKYAQMLDETTESPKRQLALMIQHLGEDFVKQKVEEAIEINEGEGMMTADKSRRRTKGGVFFFIIKEDMDPDVKRRVFPGYGGVFEGKVIDWEERTEHIPELFENPGTMRYNRILIHGKAGEVKVLENSVMLTITHERRGEAPYPRGIPTPPDTITKFAVYVGIRHWDAIKDAHAKSPHDPFIIEGDIFFDPELECIAVMATSITTKLLDKNYRRLARSGEAPVSPSARKQMKQKRKEENKKKKQEEQKQKRQEEKIPAAPVEAVIAEPAAEEDSLSLPDNLPADVADKLRQLYSAAETLQQRINAKVEKGQRTTLEEKLLETTQRQFEDLLQKHQ